MATSEKNPTYNRRRAKRLALASVGAWPEKRARSGNNVSHAHNKTKRLFRPNLQRAKILVDGRLVSVRIDAKTLRTLTKPVKERKPRAKKAAKVSKAAAKPSAKKT
jgi:large subunit ribosomal protein L28